ncbi:MAG: leucyl aminopeptidase [Planctomycetota bacterium]|nr:leucyl aminopeptidase [Planctomycetota bacterium]
MTQVLKCEQSISTVDADALMVGYFSDRFPDYTNELSTAMEDFVGNLVNNGDFDAKPNDVVTIPYPAGIKASRLILVGLGEEKEYNAKTAFRAAGAAAKSTAIKPRETVAMFFPTPFISDAVAGTLVGSQGQDIFRSEAKITPFQSLLIANATDDAIRAGEVLGRATNTARNLVNQPPNLLFPETLAETASQIGQQAGFEVEIWDEKTLAENECRTLLAVAQGSIKKPRMLIMRYQGAGDGKTLGLVGKGVTFDSGGYSLKPTDAMFDMKCDMGGAATVIGAMQAIAELKLPINVSAYCGLVENMVSGSAYKLGDVIKSRNGKTVEIHNTDAEGRLVLADVLDVAVKDGVSNLIDFATLTGACMIALGTDCAGLFSNNQEWCDQFKFASDQVGEDTWQLPMTPNFSEQIKSNVADIKNMGNGRWGGAITAAKFLEEFVSDVPWVHVDIAGPAWSDSPKTWIDAGGSGCYVRTLVQLASQY